MPGIYARTAISATPPALCFREDITINHELNIQGIAVLLFKLFRWICIVGFMLSVIGLAMAVQKDYPLLTDASTTDGTIIGFEKQSLNRQGRLTIAHMFPYQVAIVSFQDKNGIPRKVVSRIGNNSRQIGERVKVLYSNRNPENAMVDNGAFHNWLSEYVWLFVMMASVLGIRRFSKQPDFTVPGARA